MTNKHNTKRTLLASILSMVLCFSMLIGSTLAWFTDTATTGVNTITSGNLDMKVSYKNKDVATWTEVSPSEKLFDDAAFWEPGYTEVAYLKIENKGSLAFKYQLTVNVLNEIAGKNKDGGEIKLSEVLKYDLIPLTSDTEYADRAAALEAVVNPQNLDKEAFSGSINANTAENYYALVVYMPDSTDNKANHNGTDIPSIQLGVTFVATQNTVESDSYNDQYDVSAAYPVVAVPMYQKLEDVSNYGAGAQATDVVIENADGSVKATIPAANYDTTNESKYTTNVKVELTDSSTNSTTYDIDVSVVDGNGAEVTLSEPATIEVQLAEALTNVVVKHNGTAMTEVANNAFTADQQYSYNATSGMLTVYSKTFSPFAVTYDTNYQATINGTGYASLRTALYYANPGETVILQKDWGYNYSTSYALVVIGDDITLDLNGHCIASQNAYVILTQKADNFKIKNGTVKVLSTSGNAFGIACQGGSANLENVTVEVLAPSVEVYNYATAMRAANQDGYKTVVGTYDNVTIKEIKDSNSIGYTVGVVAQGASITDNEKLYTDSSTVNLNNCNIDVSGFAVAGNGSTHGTRVDVNGGTLRSTATAIYHPQYGTLNISDAAILGNESGIEIRAGKLNMTSGTVSGNADPFVGEGNDSGATMFGTAIAVSQHTTELPITVTINGGTLSGLYSIYEDDLVGGQSEKSKDVSIILNGGTFNGEIKSVNNKVTDNR